MDEITQNFVILSRLFIILEFVRVFTFLSVSIKDRYLRIIFFRYVCCRLQVTSISSITHKKVHISSVLSVIQLKFESSRKSLIGDAKLTTGSQGIESTVRKPVQLNSSRGRIVVCIYNS
jgi:hypothetical protein